MFNSKSVYSITNDTMTILIFLQIVHFSSSER